MKTKRRRNCYCLTKNSLMDFFVLLVTLVVDFVWSFYQKKDITTTEELNEIVIKMYCDESRATNEIPVSLAWQS
ncbi:19306_t:CDS:2 [Funneliformis geosporum]|nr:19306_t:CDS:2 [Funneliformis geosporum]